MELINQASLAAFTTFGVEASVAHLYRIEEADEVKVAAQYLESPLVLGGGSNILPIGSIDRNVIRIELKGLEIIDETPEHVLVKVAAGEVWHELVLWSLKENLGGIENLSLIPGSVGAAPIQNIGAYGVELVQVFDQLDAIELGTGRGKTFSKEECRFGYRDSIFKKEVAGKYIIISVTLRFSKHPVINTSYGAIAEVLQRKGIASPGIQDVSDAVIEIRQSKLPDPKVIGNAGSFFKNPIIPKADRERLISSYPDMPHFPESNGSVKVPAGWLIEQAGWKGKRVGEVGSYEKQALVLVNYGHATGTEVWNFANEIVQSVKEKFGIEIVPEVNLWK